VDLASYVDEKQPALLEIIVGVGVWSHAFKEKACLWLDANVVNMNDIAKLEVSTWQG